MDVIDCLPPGLYEMLMTPRAGDELGATLEPGKPGEWVCHFETRSLDDIRALGRNSVKDDLAFAAAARLSEMNLSIYRSFFQPFVRALTSHTTAELANRMNPLRLSYALFASSNPFMRGVGVLAKQVEAHRRPVAAGNPFLQWQEEFSRQTTAALDGFRKVRDRLVEQLFFGFYGSPTVQGLLGLNTGGAPVRSLPGNTPRQRVFIEERKKEFAAKLAKGGFEEALMRAVFYITSTDRGLGNYSGRALNGAQRRLPQLSASQLKEMARDQFFVLLLYPENAIEAIAAMVPAPSERRDLLKAVRDIASAGGLLTAGGRRRLEEMARVLDQSVPDVSVLH
jgi:hypothetical protein